MIIAIILAGFFIGWMLYLGLNAISESILKVKINIENQAPQYIPPPLQEKPKEFNPHAMLTVPYRFSHEEFMAQNKDYNKLYNAKLDELGKRSQKVIDKKNKKQNQ